MCGKVLLPPACTIVVLLNVWTERQASIVECMSIKTSLCCSIKTDLYCCMYGHIDMPLLLNVWTERESSVVEYMDRKTGFYCWYNDWKTCLCCWMYWQNTKSLMTYHGTSDSLSRNPWWPITEAQITYHGTLSDLSWNPWWPVIAPPTNLSWNIPSFVSRNHQVTSHWTPDDLSRNP